MTLAISISFAVASLICLVIWCLWLWGVFDGGADNHWFENREVFSDHAQCRSEFLTSAVEVDDGTTTCLAAFLLWMSPLIVFGVCFFIAAFLVLLAR